MAVNTVSTYGSLQTLLQNMSTVQNSLNNEQEAISSGYASQTFQGLQGSIEQFTSLGAQVSRLTDYQQSNSSIVAQLQTSSTTLGQIVQVATSLKGLILAQVSGTASSASFTQQLQANRTTLINELNTTFAGSYIFGGTNTGQPPVADPVPNPLVVGTPDSAYYRGSAQNVTLRVGDGNVITNSVRADNSAFQQIFAGIAQALQPTASTADLQNAENLINQGLQGVIALQSTVNSNVVNVQQVDTQSQTLQTYFENLTKQQSQADVVTLSTQVAQDQTTLQASFSVFARISSLSLVNFLK